MSSARLNDNGPKAKRGELRHCCLTATALMLSRVISVVMYVSEVNLVILAQFTVALAFKVVQHSLCTISDTHAMNELLHGSSSPMVLVMSDSHVSVNSL